MDVISNCINQYFGHVSTVTLGVSVAPGYANSSITPRANIPSIPAPNLTLLGFSPSGIVNSLLNGKAVHLNKDLGSPTVLLECVKPAGTLVDNLVFNTNAGTSLPITLPAQRGESPIAHPAPPPLPPKPIEAIWTSDLSVATVPLAGHCTCVAVS